MVVANNQINDNRKCRHIVGSFNGHAYALVRWGAHCPMEHIPGFTRSHWMTPSGKCGLHRIAPAAAMVDELGAKHKTLTTNYF